MIEQERLATLTQILSDLLGDDSIKLAMETVREDVPGWDSLAYINFIVATEAQFRGQVPDSRRGIVPERRIRREGDRRRRHLLTPPKPHAVQFASLSVWLPSDRAHRILCAGCAPEEIGAAEADRVITDVL
jgi:acyl carrier protein